MIKGFGRVALLNFLEVSTQDLCSGSEPVVPKFNSESASSDNFWDGH